LWHFPGPSKSRSYNGSASVGDFLTINLDASSQTLSYSHLSNGDHGTIQLPVNQDGTYTLSDPAGNLIAAHEVALITALQTGSISLATWAGHDYNYMQFRTSSGGVEVGSVSIDSQGDVSVTGYWPYGSIGQTAFNGGSFPGAHRHASLENREPLQLSLRCGIEIAGG